MISVRANMTLPPPCSLAKERRKKTRRSDDEDCGCRDKEGRTRRLATATPCYSPSGNPTAFAAEECRWDERVAMRMRMLDSPPNTDVPGPPQIVPSSASSKSARLNRVPTLTLVLRRRRMCCMSAYALADVVSRRRWSISNSNTSPNFIAKSAILPSCASIRLKIYALKRTSSTSGVLATLVTQRRLGRKSRADFVSRGAQLAQLEILQPSQSSFPTIRIGARVRLTWNCW